MDAVVADTADLRAFLHLKDDDFAAHAIGRIFHAELYVLEELRVPQRLKITAQRLFIVDIAVAAEDARFQRVAAHAAISDEIDALNDQLLLLSGSLRIGGGMVLNDVFAGSVIQGRGEEIGAQ